MAVTGRPPHGGRGLKSEIIDALTDNLRRPPHGGRGLKSDGYAAYIYPRRSSSTRGTWIEINTYMSWSTHVEVVLHTGDVD